MPCPGLADAVQHADEAAIDAAVAAAAALHPARRAGRRPGLHPLRAGRRADPRRRPAARRPGPRPDGSAEAVAAQALRRIGAEPAPAAAAAGALTVILSGRPAALPATALAYAEGRCRSAATRRTDGPGRRTARR